MVLSHTTPISLQGSPWFPRYSRKMATRSWLQRFTMDGLSWAGCITAFWRWCRLTQITSFWFWQVQRWTSTCERYLWYQLPSYRPSRSCTDPSVEEDFSKTLILMAVQNTFAKNNRVKTRVDMKRRFDQSNEYPRVRLDPAEQWQSWAKCMLSFPSPDHSKALLRSALAKYFQLCEDHGRILSFGHVRQFCWLNWNVEYV